MKIMTILMVVGAGSLLAAQAPRRRRPRAAAQLRHRPPISGPAPQNESKIAGVASKDVANIDDPNSPFEKTDTTYRFIGARFRYIIVPKFYMGIFGDGGTTVGVPAFGPEFTIRKNGFEYVMSVMYASYAMDPTPFKAKTDPNDAWEVVDTNIKSLYFMSDFLWSAEMSPKFSFIYGGGFGLAACSAISIVSRRTRHRRSQQPGQLRARALAPRIPEPDVLRQGQRSLRRLHRTELGQRRIEAHPFSVDVGADRISFQTAQAVHGARRRRLEHLERPVLRPGAQLRTHLIAHRAGARASSSVRTGLPAR